MASGDKVYIADKKTLDVVKSTADFINSKIGKAGDDDGVATLFGKIYQVYKKVGEVFSYVSSIKGSVSDDGNVGIGIKNIYTYVSSMLPYIQSQTALNHNAAEQGTLSQKLSYIIEKMVSTSNLHPIARSEYHTLVSGLNTVVDITGAGVFHGARSEMFVADCASKITATIDGVPYTVTPMAGCTYLCRSYDGASNPVHATTLDMFQISVPIHFKKSFKLEVTIANVVAGSEACRVIYDLYT